MHRTFRMVFSFTVVEIVRLANLFGGCFSTTLEEYIIDYILHDVCCIISCFLFTHTHICSGCFVEAANS